MTRQLRMWMIAGLAGGVGVACICVAAGVWAVLQGRGPAAVVWDFRRGRADVAAVNWPADVKGGVFERRGQMDLTVINTAGEVVFHQRVQDFICERKGAVLGNLYVHFANGSTAEEAYRIAKKIMTDRKCEPREFLTLEKWHEGMVAKMSEGDFIRMHEKHYDYDWMLYPGFSARVRASEIGGRPEDGDCRFMLSVSF